MKWHIDGNTLTLENGKCSQFAFPIKQAIDAGNIVVVVLTVPAGQMMTENVFGVSGEGGILWQIERIKETSTNPKNRYMDVRVSSHEAVTVGNWNGMEVTVDVTTGRVKSMEFTK